MNEEGLMRYVTAQKVANPWRGCSMIFEGLPSNARSTAHGARSAAATELRLSRCCDGELRRPAPLRSFCASRPRRS